MIQNRSLGNKFHNVATDTAYKPIFSRIAWIRHLSTNIANLHRMIYVIYWYSLLSLWLSATFSIHIFTCRLSYCFMAISCHWILEYIICIFIPCPVFQHLVSRVHKTWNHKCRKSLLVKCRVHSCQYFQVISVFWLIETIPSAGIININKFTECLCVNIVTIVGIKQLQDVSSTNSYQLTNVLLKEAYISDWAINQCTCHW